MRHRYAIFEAPVFAVATTGGLYRGVGRRRLRRAAPPSLAGGSHENAWVIVPAGAAALIIS
jgi:hypothetical protein